MVQCIEFTRDANVLHSFSLSKINYNLLSISFLNIVTDWNGLSYLAYNRHQNGFVYFDWIGSKNLEDGVGFAILVFL